MLIIRPTIFPLPVLIPCARAICWLDPTARRPHPYSVPKNQYMMPMSTAVISSIRNIGFSIEKFPTFRREISMFLYLLILSGTLARLPRSVPNP